MQSNSFFPCTIKLIPSQRVRGNMALEKAAENNEIYEKFYNLHLPVSSHAHSHFALVRRFFCAGLPKFQNRCNLDFRLLLKFSIKTNKNCQLQDENFVSDQIFSPFLMVSLYRVLKIGQRAATQKPDQVFSLELLVGRVCAGAHTKI